MRTDACTCGNPKPAGRPECFNCMVRREESEGKRCECGGRKSAHDELCPDCEYDDV